MADVSRPSGPVAPRPAGGWTALASTAAGSAPAPSEVPVRGEMPVRAGEFAPAQEQAPQLPEQAQGDTEVDPRAGW